MSGETFLCEVCGLLIDWEHSTDRDEIRWYVLKPHDYIPKILVREYTEMKPSPHNHVPRLPKVVK